MKKKNGINYGIGINDYEGKVTTIKGKREKHIPSYKAWASMLMRCYDDKFQEKHPTYKGCKVCDEWLSFSTFKKWYDKNYRWDLEEKGLRPCMDKDLLSEKGNKIYSPNTCVFLPSKINSVLASIDRKDDSSTLSGYKGVRVFKQGKKRYYASIRIDGDMVGLGCYEKLEDAHKAYNKAKLEQIIKMQELMIELGGYSDKEIRAMQKGEDMNYIEKELEIRKVKVDNNELEKLVENYRDFNDDETKMTIFKLEYPSMRYLAKQSPFIRYGINDNDIDSTIYFAFNYLLNQYRGKGRYFGNYLRLHFPIKFQYYLKFDNINSTPMWNCQGKSRKYQNFDSTERLKDELFEPSTTNKDIVKFEFNEIYGNKFLDILMDKIESNVSLLEAKCIYKHLILRAKTYAVIKTPLPKKKSKLKWEVDKEEVKRIALNAFAKLRKNQELQIMYKDYYENIK